MKRRLCLRPLKNERFKHFLKFTFMYLSVNLIMYNHTVLIIYMKKIFHSDWLRAVQFFFFNSAEKN